MHNRTGFYVSATFPRECYSVLKYFISRETTRF